MTTHRGRRLPGANAIKPLIAIAVLLISALSACAAIDTGESTPSSNSASAYLQAVDSESEPVIELEAEVRSGVESIVEQFGDQAIPGSASGTVISLNRKSQELADEAEDAAFAVSMLNPPARCQEFHERQLEALRQIGQEGFEYASGTDIQGLSDPRLDLDAIDRGYRARLEAQNALSEASVLREACRR